MEKMATGSMRRKQTTLLPTIGTLERTDSKKINSPGTVISSISTKLPRDRFGMMPSQKPRKNLAPSTQPARKVLSAAQTQKLHFKPISKPNGRHSSKLSNWRSLPRFLNHNYQLLMLM